MKVTVEKDKTRLRVFEDDQEIKRIEVITIVPDFLYLNKGLEREKIYPLSWVVFTDKSNDER